MSSGTSGQSSTGMSNQLYDLVSVLYHSLESGATNDKYIQDAQQTGDDDLVQFFQTIQQQDKQRIQQAKTLLSKKGIMQS